MMLARDAHHRAEKTQYPEIKAHNERRQRISVGVEVEEHVGCRCKWAL